MGGSLYRVKLLGDVEPSPEDPHFPSWRGRRAVVLRVVERNITLTHTERRRLFLQWGGSHDEYDDMVLRVLGSRP